MKPILTAKKNMKNSETYSSIFWDDECGGVLPFNLTLLIFTITLSRILYQ